MEPFPAPFGILEGMGNMGNLIKPLPVQTQALPRFVTRLSILMNVDSFASVMGSYVPAMQ